MPAEIPDGAVIVARAIVNSSLWTMRHEDLRLAILCIVKANWKERRWYDGKQTITICRGQFVTSRRHLAEESQLSEQQTRTSLRRLEKCGFLTRKPTQDYTVITLPKYDVYQDLGKYSDKIDPDTNPRLTHASPRRNPTPTQPQPQLKKAKKDKKEKKGKKGKTEPGGAAEPPPEPQTSVLASLSYFKMPGPRAKRAAVEELNRLGIEDEAIMARAATMEAQSMDFYEFVKWCRGRKGNGRHQAAPAEPTIKFKHGDHRGTAPRSRA